jgi:hypothetical protein
LPVKVSLTPVVFVVGMFDVVSADVVLPPVQPANNKNAMVETDRNTNRNLFFAIDTSFIL